VHGIAVVDQAVAKARARSMTVRPCRRVHHGGLERGVGDTGFGVTVAGDVA